MSAVDSCGGPCTNRTNEGCEPVWWGCLHLKEVPRSSRRLMTSPDWWLCCAVRSKKQLWSSLQGKKKSQRHTLVWACVQMMCALVFFVANHPYTLANGLSGGRGGVRSVLDFVSSIFFRLRGVRREIPCNSPELKMERIGGGVFSNFAWRGHFLHFPLQCRRIARHDPPFVLISLADLVLGFSFAVFIEGREGGRCRL